MPHLTVLEMDRYPQLLNIKPFFSFMVPLILYIISKKFHHQNLKLKSTDKIIIYIIFVFSMFWNLLFLWKCWKMSEKIKRRKIMYLLKKNLKSYIKIFIEENWIYEEVISIA